MKSVGLVLLACGFAFAPLVQAQRAGVIDDPASSVDVRAEKSADAAVIATVKTGEPFTFESANDADWCKVTLASGKSGSMQLSRIRLHFTEKNLPSREKDRPENGDRTIRERARTELRRSHTARCARRRQGAETIFLARARCRWRGGGKHRGRTHCGLSHSRRREVREIPCRSAIAYRMMVRNRILSDGLMPPANLYLSRHFPLTAKAMFQREMVDWVSPNGLYAIRKVFTDELELGGSKVERAELIEKKTGRVLFDLTPDDIGTGAQREGEALWAPDSKRVACLSSDLTQQRGNLFSTPRPAPHKKQTAVYQLSGDLFTRVELPLGEVPGRESDTELERAILGHEYIEPIRWQKPNVLVLERHEYYETLKPTAIGDVKFESIHTLSRWYRITATIDSGGKTTLAWKLRKN